jgi:hypothetical protein
MAHNAGSCLQQEGKSGMQAPERNSRHAPATPRFYELSYARVAKTFRAVRAATKQF